MQMIRYECLTPEQIKDMTDEELTNLVKFVQRQAVDFEVVHGLIRDRNEIWACYNKLYIQLQDLGVKPCIDYYTMGKTGRPKSKDKKSGKKSKSQKKRRKVTKNV